MIVINSILFVLITITGSVTYGNDFNVGTDKFVVDASDGTLTTKGRIKIQKSDNNVSDHIHFYNGTTRVGEIGVEDSWLRINQETATNIYTPRMFRADGGFQVDGSDVITGSGVHTGNGSGLTSLNASNISSGTLNSSRLPNHGDHQAIHSHNFAPSSHGSHLNSQYTQFSDQSGNVWYLTYGSASTFLHMNNTGGSGAVISEGNSIGFGSTTYQWALVTSHGNGGKRASYDGDSNWDFYSDRRLKTEIEIETNILERIMKIDVVSYKFKDGLQFRKQLGFLAQDIEPHFPLLITEQEDEQYDFKVKTLGYSTFGVLAFGGIRELKIEKDREIDALKAENETLKATIDALTQRIEALENR